MSKLSDKLLSNPSFLSAYSVGMDQLFASGIFEILREIGTVHPLLATHKHKSAIAEAYRSIGYNQALDDLINFKEKFVSQTNSPEPVPADFGGLRLALQNNNLTEQEANEYRESRKRKPTA